MSLHVDMRYNIRHEGDLIGACGMGERNERGNMLTQYVFGALPTNSQSADAHVPNS